jgi:hypothetical protein
VAYRTEPGPVVAGEPFAVEAVVCPRGGAPPPTGLRVDADMPEHRHGMNYRAAVTRRAAGGFRAEGLLFHMAGRWRLLFDVEGPGGAERAAAEVTVE